MVTLTTRKMLIVFAGMHFWMPTACDVHGLPEVWETLTWETDGDLLQMLCSETLLVYYVCCAHFLVRLTSNILISKYGDLYKPNLFTLTSPAM
jgi:hypothetical protein